MTMVFQQFKYAADVSSDGKPICQMTLVIY